MDDLMYDKAALKIYDDAKMRKYYYLLVCQYEMVFKDELVEVNMIEGNVQVLRNIIEKITKNKNLSLDDIDKIILDEKNNFQRIMKSYLAKLRNSSDVFKANLTMDDNVKQKFDELFYDFVYKYCPLLNSHPTKEHIALAKALDQLYLEGKLAMFQIYYGALKQKINENNKNDEELFKKLDVIYNSLDEFSKLNKVINFGKMIEEKNIYESDLTILAERAEFRVKKNQLLRASKELHSKLISIYGEDIDLSFKA